MALNKRQKKAIYRIAIAGAIYLCVFAGGCSSDDGAMAVAMRKVRGEVNSARAAIKKEMDKPFILRIFGSIFGQENNTFAKMKERLPKIMAEAMPDFLSRQTEASPASRTACEGMRLVDALTYLHDGKVQIASLSWTFDDTLVEQIYIAGPGQVLQVREEPEQSEDTASGQASGQGTTKVHLLIQMQHGFTDEGGLGADYTTRQENLSELRAQAQDYQDQSLFLQTWLDQLPTADRQQALAKGLPLVQWSSLPVTWRVLSEWPERK